MKGFKKVVVLSDGFVVGRRNLVLNLNRNRKYVIMNSEGKVLVSNLPWCEVLRWLNVCRFGF